MKRLVLAALAVTAVTATFLEAQLPKAETVVQVRVEPAQLAAKSGRAADFTVVATIREGFHINSNKPLQDYLIPTRVELAEEGPFVLEGLKFPAGELKSFEFAPDEKLSVYEGTVKVAARLRAKAEAPTGQHTVRLIFHFQACNDQLCLPPARREVTLSVKLDR
ncbi:MAG: hypothetical protein HYY26_04220 [Acidobacteria bacterium]|nr:hypothetical protein [Acidobacteriota bacterium]